MLDRPLICAVLTQPDRIKGFDLPNWQALLSQGYSARLLGRLYSLFTERELFRYVPDELKWHFSSAFELSLSHARDMHIEVEKVEAALRMVGIVPVFLKGVAYDLASDRSGKGRLYADVDIYVPVEQLPSAEHALGLHGWRSEKLSDYDNEYYRRWMHEIPPLVHAERAVTLDVHHSLLPLTCRYAFSAKRLMMESTMGGHRILCNTDRILHAICHLFMESEYDKGLRDLSDLDLLLRQHAETDPLFWTRLLERADDLGVGRLCFYALRYTLMIFNTPIPEDVAEQSQRKWAPNPIVLRLADSLFLRVLTTPPPTDGNLSIRLAHFAMYVRGHWLRMPLRLLIPHLLRKGWMGLSAGLSKQN
ncbi:nucleotidyltransferase family protein [Bowmanella dokdonensis]|uniref:Nucleotidyltransferase family protein n=1 Tax=Bowmanella dokdonensis TaxID=751969 RepID=A0A939DS96_9ALTE|nr:nucleotidyltransferase family protein [Bowmanella dokdonensis]MBN7827290.1 nucleotidyltransferase family protein [Bowmanella dokdonensis]